MPNLQDGFRPKIESRSLCVCMTFPVQHAELFFRSAESLRGKEVGSYLDALREMSRKYLEKLECKVFTESAYFEVVYTVEIPNDMQELKQERVVEELEMAAKSFWNKFHFNKLAQRWKANENGSFRIE